MKETKSNWACVTDTLMQDDQFIKLGQQASSSLRNNPIEMINDLSYYKFASKLIKKNKQILHLASQEGLGTYILGKECGFSLGIDSNLEAIAQAKQMFTENCVDFSESTIENFSLEKKDWDAVVYSHTGSPLSLEQLDDFLLNVFSHLSSQGIAILNLINPTRSQGNDSLTPIRKTIQKHFDPLFTFSLNEGVIQPTLSPQTERIIFVGCKKVLPD